MVQKRINIMESLNKITISTGALRHNFAVCRHHAGDADIIAMVKADAYGHGMIECARVFVETGAAALGVAEVVEGVKLREAGFTVPVFILAGIIPQTAQAAVENNLTPVVVDNLALRELNGHAQTAGKKIDIHVKVDAGMGRQGTLPQELVALIREIDDHSCLNTKGVLAHFPMADEPDSSNSDHVLAAFSNTARQIKEEIPHPCMYHLANSGGLFYVRGSQFDMVRPGISLYGCYPDGESGRHAAVESWLEPAMCFSTKVIQVRKVETGIGLGYGHSFFTSKPTTVAVLPVGYEDGYLRKLSNRAQVLVNGCRAPVIGKISMNLTLIDATDVGSVKVGDEVVLMGPQGTDKITADDIAGWMDTINYEVLCLFGHMNDRVFVD